MNKTTYPGIDYSGLGSTANRDPENHIRYGIIPARDVGYSWYDAGEPYYGDPRCPYCGNVVIESSSKKVRKSSRGDKDYFCLTCKKSMWSDGCFPDEACGVTYENDGYSLNEDSSGDLWAFQSPYYTYAQFCSPCAPGAGYLANFFDAALEGKEYQEAAEKAGFPKVYCLGHDWFEDHKAPYPVFSVKTGKEVVVREVRVGCPNCKGTGKDTVKRLAGVRGVTEKSILAEIEEGTERFLGFERYDMEGIYVGTFTCFRCAGEGHYFEKVEEEI